MATEIKRVKKEELAAAIDSVGENLVSVVANTSVSDNCEYTIIYTEGGAE